MSEFGCPRDGCALFPKQEALASAPAAVAPRPCKEKDLMEALLRHDTAAAVVVVSRYAGRVCSARTRLPRRGTRHRLV